MRRIAFDIGSTRTGLLIVFTDNNHELPLGVSHLKRMLPLCKGEVLLPAAPLRLEPPGQQEDRYPRVFPHGAMFGICASELFCRNGFSNAIGVARPPNFPGSFPVAIKNEYQYLPGLVGMIKSSDEGINRLWKVLSTAYCAPSRPGDVYCRTVSAGMPKGTFGNAFVHEATACYIGNLVLDKGWSVVQGAPREFAPNYQLVILADLGGGFLDVAVMAWGTARHFTKVAEVSFPVGVARVLRERRNQAMNVHEIGKEGGRLREIMGHQVHASYVGFLEDLLVLVIQEAIRQTKHLECELLLTGKGWEHALGSSGFCDAMVDRLRASLARRSVNGVKSVSFSRHDTKFATTVGCCAVTEQAGGQALTLDTAPSHTFVVKDSGMIELDRYDPAYPQGRPSRATSVTIGDNTYQTQHGMVAPPEGSVPLEIVGKAFEFKFLT